jgi:hypothetical protein
LLQPTGQTVLEKALRVTKTYRGTPIEEEVVSIDVN